MTTYFPFIIFFFVFFLVAVQAIAVWNKQCNGHLIVGHIAVIRCSNTGRSSLQTRGRRRSEDALDGRSLEQALEHAARSTMLQALVRSE